MDIVKISSGSNIIDYNFGFNMYIEELHETDVAN